jgi:hypothetical protein
MKYRNKSYRRLMQRLKKLKDDSRITLCIDMISYEYLLFLYVSLTKRLITINLDANFPYNSSKMQKIFRNFNSIVLNK